MNVDFTVLLTAFVLVFIAELGDKTQLVAFSLTSTARSPVIIFIATSLALTCSSILAALLGGAASQFLPRYTSWAAAALFFGFGFYILFSKEAPPVKACFLKTVESETALLRAVPRVWRRAGRPGEELGDILRQESGHALVFRTLLREKRLFQDDINEDKKMEELSAKLALPRGLAKMPFTEALDAIIRVEEAVRDMYAWLCAHLSLEHHSGDTLCGILGSLAAEENEHIALFRKMRGEARP